MKYLIQKERTHLFAPSIQIAAMVELKGKISEDILCDAIQKAIDNNEVFHCRIVMDETGKAFYETGHSASVVIHKFEGEWEKVVTREEKHLFALQHGDMIRFFIKEELNITQLLIIAHHLVGDGLSMTYFIQDILDALNGIPLIYKELKLYDMKHVPAESKLNPMMGWMLKRVNNKWDKTGKTFHFSDSENMINKYWSSRKTSIIAEKVKEDVLFHLERKAKSNHVSVNSTLVTAFARAAEESTEFGIPVSLRENNNHTMANLATAISIKYQYNEKQDFWENARKVHSIINKKLSNNKSKFFLTQFMNQLSPTLIDSAYFSAFDGYENEIAARIRNMFGYVANPKAINISNLTRISTKDKDANYQIADIAFVPPIVPNASCMIGVITYESQMVITLHLLDNELRQQKEDLFKRAITVMKEL